MYNIKCVCRYFRQFLLFDLRSDWKENQSINVEWKEIYLVWTYNRWMANISFGRRMNPFPLYYHSIYSFRWSNFLHITHYDIGIVHAFGTRTKYYYWFLFASTDLILALLTSFSNCKDDERIYVTLSSICTSIWWKLPF